jgi:hypothetical protein
MKWIDEFGDRQLNNNNNPRQTHSSMPRTYYTKLRNQQQHQSINRLICSLFPDLPYASNRSTPRRGNAHQLFALNGTERYIRTGLGVMPNYHLRLRPSHQIPQYSTKLELPSTVDGRHFIVPDGIKLLDSIVQTQRDRKMKCGGVISLRKALPI